MKISRTIMKDITKTVLFMTPDEVAEMHRHLGTDNNSAFSITISHTNVYAICQLSTDEGPRLCAQNSSTLHSWRIGQSYAQGRADKTPPFNAVKPVSVWFGSINKRPAMFVKLPPQHERSYSPHQKPATRNRGKVEEPTLVTYEGNGVNSDPPTVMNVLASRVDPALFSEMMLEHAEKVAAGHAEKVAAGHAITDHDRLIAAVDMVNDYKQKEKEQLQLSVDENGYLVVSFVTTYRYNKV